MLHGICALLCCGAATIHAPASLVPSVPLRAELKEGDSSVYELHGMLPDVYYEVRVSNRCGLRCASSPPTHVPIFLNRCSLSVCPPTSGACDQLSYAASSPMHFQLRLARQRPGGSSGGMDGDGRRQGHLRKLLNVEKVMFGTDGDGVVLLGHLGAGGDATGDVLRGGEGEDSVPVLTVLATREGVRPPRSATAGVPERTSAVFELLLERLVFGLPVSVWRLVALLGASIPAALCCAVPRLRSTLRVIGGGGAVPPGVPRTTKRGNHLL